MGLVEIVTEELLYLKDYPPPGVPRPRGWKARLVGPGGKAYELGINVQLDDLPPDATFLPASASFRTPEQAAGQARLLFERRWGHLTDPEPDSQSGLLFVPAGLTHGSVWTHIVWEQQGLRPLTETG